MPAILFESAIRVTLIALAVGLVLRLLKIQAAHLKHAAWAAVAAIMLAQPLLVVWTPKASVAILPAEPIATRLASVPAVPDPVPGPGAQVTIAPETYWSWSSYALSVYFVGVAMLLARLGIGAVRVRRLIREAEPRDGMLTHASCVTPVTVGSLRPAVVLPVDWGFWPEGQRQAVLAHESEHIRRHDPLFQRLALLNRAVFWFHPLAWWLERHLAALAEEACDAAVLDRGHDPRDYSECLLGLARTVQSAGTRVHELGMAMPGAGLPRRIRQILAGVRAPRVTRARMACTALLCVAASVAFTAGKLAHAQPAVKYEFATIKPNEVFLGGVGFNYPSAGRISIRGITLLGLVGYAYTAGPMYNIEIRGGPNWIDRDRYDLDAQAGANIPIAEHRLRMRTLLAERFGVKIHTESKEVDVYALVLARNDGKLGPQVRPFSGQCGTFMNAALADPKMKAVLAPKGPAPEEPTYLPTPNPGGPRPGCTTMTGPPGMWLEGATMADLARMLSVPATMLGRKVVDRTGLTGEFDMRLDFRFPFPTLGGEAPPIDPLAPSLFTALQEQLGLKLEPARGSADVLVVDNAERPSEN